MNKRRLIEVACILIFGAAGIPLISPSAVVVLKTGEEVVGTIIKRTNDSLEISVRGEPRVCQMQNVKEIRGRKPFPELTHSHSEILLPSLDNYRLALEKAANEEFKEAEEIFRNVADADPNDSNAQQAISICEDVRNNKISRKYGIYLFQGALQMLKENYEVAAVMFNKALAIRPDNVELNYNLGCAYQFLGKHDQAVSYFDKLLQIDPQDTDVLYGIGISSYSLGKYDRAVVYFEKLLCNIPNDPNVYAYLGDSYLALGDIEKGKGYVRKAKDIYESEGNAQQAKEMQDLLN